MQRNLYEIMKACYDNYAAKSCTYKSNGVFDFASETMPKRHVRRRGATPNWLDN